MPVGNVVPFHEARQHLLCPENLTSKPHGHRINYLLGVSVRFQDPVFTLMAQTEDLRDHV
ncbi:MAG: hypothetical protein JOY71_16540 [Acetobacteraceae bacterium]|nr:hypothetical protein [Acetobacteraceae bacterium]MBV8523704.1 hypothetical protein [Acetobacteraceae bacterium]